MPQCCFDCVDLSLSGASLEHWTSAIFLPRDEIDAAKVARGFESHPLRQRVFSFRDSLLLCLKNAHLAGSRHPKSTGEPVSSGSNASFEDFSLFALWAVDSACRWTWRLTLNKRRVVAGPSLIGAC